MKTIKYESDEDKALTSCPHELAAMVGSLYCQDACPYNIKTDRVKQIVTCGKSIKNNALKTY